MHTGVRKEDFALRECQSMGKLEQLTVFMESILIQLSIFPRISIGFTVQTIRLVEILQIMVSQEQRHSIRVCFLERKDFLEIGEGFVRADAFKWIRVQVVS